MASQPLVSVIIPTYNYARFICEAIESVLASSFPISEVEIIVIDDGSTDDTAEEVKLYKDKVKYIAQENLGKAWATRVGIEHAQGRYIFNLDADDLFLPNKLKTVVNLFEADKDLVHVAHPAIGWIFDDNTKGTEPIPSAIVGRKIVGKELLSYFYKRNILFGGGSTFAARAEVLKHVPIPKKIDMSIDEYLVLVTLNQGYSFFIEEPLSIWRIHGKNFSSQNLNANIHEQLKLRRWLASVEAVQANLTNVGIEEDIKILYHLKTYVVNSAFKERLGEKSFSDILKLWSWVFNTFNFFGIEAFGIVKHYDIFNSLVPRSTRVLLKRVLNK